MTEAQIIEKIKYGLALASELPEIEFKTARNNIPNDTWKTISSFANRRGRRTHGFWGIYRQLIPIC